MEYFNMRDILPKTEKGNEFNEFFEEIAEQTDGKIPKDLADMLLKENRDPNYVIRIHRCLADKKEGIFKDGLRIKGGTNLDYTTSDYSNSDMTLMISIRDGHAYKNREGEEAICVVTKIPKEYLEYEKGKTKPILFPTTDAAEQSGGMITMQRGVQTILLPEFVLGAVEYSNGKITGFSPNERYKNEHNYLGDGLVFPDTVLYDYYSKTGTQRVSNGFDAMDLQDKQDEQVTQIMIKECNEYEIAKREGKLPRTEDETVRREEILPRTEEEIKQFSLQEMPKSRFMAFIDKFKNMFRKKENAKEKVGEEFDDRS